jgi:beta-lactamase regulating signal transducer with metallopeptidase domain
MMLAVLEAALRSLALAVVVGAGLRVCRVRNVLALKAAWGLVLASALFMPLLAPWLARFMPATASVTLPLRRVVQPVQVEPIAQPTTVRRLAELPPVASAIASRPAAPSRYLSKPAPAPEIAPSLNVTSAVLTNTVARTQDQTAPTQPALTPVSVSLRSIAALLYLGVAAALLLRLFYGLATALHLLFAAEPIPADARTQFGGISLRVSRTVSSPVTIGSAVVLPADYVEWDAEKLRIVLAHERSHIRQGDFYLQLLAGLYAALVWFSPLGWWLKRVLSDLAETISDRAGLEQAASTTSYAQVLLEFAAAPRPTVLGVAMARSGSLSRRIERLLNDNSFRQAFAGGRRRAIVAVLLVPVALFAATALIRVQAAQDVQATPSAKPESAAPPAPQAKPSPAHVAADAQPNADAGASDEEEPEVVVMPPLPKAVVVPPIPPISVVVPKIPPFPKVIVPKIVIPPMPAVDHLVIDGRALALLQDDAPRGSRHGSRYRYSIDGDSYAIIRGDRGENMSFSGEMHAGDIDKVRKLAHGDFLWFERDDKQYYVDDPAILAQIEAMHKPMEELGKKQEELGKQQEELGKQQEALGRQQEEATVPAPDMQKEMAEIDAAMAKLKAKMGQNITQDELGDLQNKLGDLQGRLGDLQGKIGEKQGELGEQQGKLGAQQGRLGAEQGRLGAEQGRLGMEADRKVRSIIDESLTNGKAHVVN